MMCISCAHGIPYGTLVSLDLLNEPALQITCSPMQLPGIFSPFSTVPLKTARPASCSDSIHKAAASCSACVDSLTVGLSLKTGGETAGCDCCGLFISSAVSYCVPGRCPGTGVLQYGQYSKPFGILLHHFLQYMIFCTSVSYVR